MFGMDHHIQKKYPTFMTWVFLLVFLLGSGLSCQNSQTKEDEEDQKIAKATRMIDDGNYDGAISLLESYLSTQTAGERVKITLASAYAGRAGVRVENFWDLLIGFDAFDPHKKPEVIEHLIPLEKRPRGLSEDEKKLLDRLNSAWNEFRFLQRKADKVPLVDPAKRGDLMRARDLLADTPSRGSKLYRALLTVSFLKSDFASATLWYESWAKKNYRMCEPESRNLGVWIYRSMKLVQEGLIDFSVAYPEHYENYLRMRNQIQAALSLVDIFSTNLPGDVLCSLQPHS